MSYIFEKLCVKILNEYFGQIVSIVGKTMLQCSCISFKELKKQSCLPQLQVQEAVCVLIKHNLVEWEEISPNVPGYSIIASRILLFLRFPRYLTLIRDQFGEVAEIIVDTLLKEGKVTASQAIIIYCLKRYEASVNGISVTSDVGRDQHIVARDAFVSLVENKYIQRCSFPDGNKAVPKFSILEEDLYRFQTSFLDLKLIVTDIDKKKISPENEHSDTESKHPDSNIFWRLNIDRFHLELRDIEIRKCISRRIDSLAGACIGTVLKVSYTKSDPWSCTLNPVSVCEIRDHMNNLEYLDQYLSMLVEDGGGILHKYDDAAGGRYVADIRSIIETIAFSYIENIVQERFGSKAARIFKLVKAKGMMEQSHINKLAMLETKEGNVLTYRLLHDNFLKLHELRKSSAPTLAIKSIFLYHVEPKSVILMTAEWAHKAMYNLMIQREKRFNEHKRLIERKSRVETIVANLQQSGASKEHIEQVEEMFTEGEREMAKNVIDAIDKLLYAESSLDDCFFIFEMYSLYKNRLTHK